MLRVISLFIIDKIFTLSGGNKISPNAQMLYINILMHHFRYLEAKEVNCVAFSIAVNEFPNFDKYKKLLVELESFNIIQITETKILFYNMWSQYIDKSLLDVELKRTEPQSPLLFKDEMEKSEQLIELSAMKHKISKTHVVKLMDLFIREQESFKKTYPNYGDCVKHFTYWLTSNHHKVPKESIKSNNKMLG
jgi:hypothetical protein